MSRIGWQRPAERLFRLAAGTYEDPGNGTVCPVVAAAKLAGVWVNGELAAGNPDWGTPTDPTAEIEDFAGYFDLCVEELGLAQTIEIVRRTLSQATPNDPLDAAAGPLRGRPDWSARPLPTHKELPDDQPLIERYTPAADPAAGSIRFWSRLAAAGVGGVLLGTLVWFPLAVCGFLLFLLSLFVLKALSA